MTGASLRPGILARIRNPRDVAAWSEFVDGYGPLVYDYDRRRGWPIGLRPGARGVPEPALHRDKKEAPELRAEATTWAAATRTSINAWTPPPRTTRGND
jgi:hypothetical protein